jgi:DNA repair protein SbcD/Mre11
VKLLHTSDWHLGRITYNEPRAQDHDRVLAEILAYAREHRPDLIVHTGDLFDLVRPAYTDLARGITALQELAVVAPVVVLCGNHDSPALFDLLAQLVGPDAPIRFVSRARPPEQGGILHFSTVDGEVVRLAPLPFVHANRMLDGFENPATWSALYADRVHNVETSLARGLLDGFDNRRDIAIFAAHLYVGGAVLSGSERRVHVGDDYASHLEHFPAVTYAAFGHIHKPQALPGTVVNGCYAGSPIQLDFGELGEAKRVVLVEASPGRPAESFSLPLSGGRPLWRFDGTLEELAEQAQNVGQVLALVTVQTPTATVDLNAQVQQLLPDAVLLQVLELPADRRLTIISTDTTDSGPEPSVQELFRTFLAEQGTRSVTADRVLSTFDILLAAVEAEQPVRFPEEAALPLAADISTVRPRSGLLTASATTTSPGAGMATANATSVAVAGAQMRTGVCRTCGASFETPVKRGRPPTQCPTCRAR